MIKTIGLMIESAKSKMHSEFHKKLLADRAACKLIGQKMQVFPRIKFKKNTYKQEATQLKANILIQFINGNQNDQQECDKKSCETSIMKQLTLSNKSQIITTTSKFKQHVERRLNRSKKNNLLHISVIAAILITLLDFPSRFNLAQGLLIRVREQASQKDGFNNEQNLANITQSKQSRSARLLEIDAFGYLQRYGYVNESMGNANLISEDAFSEAIMSFQRFAGIAETGLIDGETVKFMQMPRCGNKDMSGKGENGNGRRKKRRRRRKKRYALQGSKWRRQELSYRISQYPTKFLNKKHEVDRQIEKAFKIWSQVAPIDFVVKLDGRVHIDIRFASGEHGDGDPFDGPGNTLAHAYFPQYGGDAHFDDQEYWTVDSYTGTNIFQVAAHELGHSLGLGHSSVREALMAPFYQKYKPNFKLHADDVLGIQALYGERNSDSDSDSSSSSTTSTSSTTTTTTSTTTAPADNDTPSRRNQPDNEDSGSGWFGGFGGSSQPKAVDLCQDSAIDAITRTEDGNTYVFRGAYYWQIKNEGLASGFPARISRDWDNLPSNLDAALTWSDGKTFFFKGDKYWRFFNKRREPGYPKQISVGFAGIPNNVDAAFVWGGNGKTYFFKRDKYWRFDSKQDPPVSSQYPKSIRNWGGLPSNGIDGAFKWENGMTYFFKDDLYYRFDDREFEVDSSARPAFPRSTAEWWFGCTNSNLPLRARNNNNIGQAANTPTSSALSSTANNHAHNSQQQTPESNLSASSKSYSDDPLSIGPSVKPRGNSLSRSILNSLSALFPSSSNSNSDNPTARSSAEAPSSQARSLSSSSSSLHDDWSFHRGLGEEANHRVFRAAARSNPHKPTSISFGRDSFSSNAAPSIDTSRWAFPLEPSSRRIKVNREESLSELRLEPTNLHDTTTKSTSAKPEKEKENDNDDE